MPIPRQDPVPPAFATLHPRHDALDEVKYQRSDRFTENIWTAPIAPRLNRWNVSRVVALQTRISAFWGIFSELKPPDA